ncbi:cytochrome c [Methylobacterium radiodurans]|uniref:Sulfite:cytochrome C oxidoreductase subunit B n=1 Tax=Methylobacterium radiodurans TaxID=2202828 RepID=A0A2U8VPA0_9HYPH|nr:cytochrome c [Methylobacterium radiodurans]AWN35206.1 sulfite:cytochrome C oxidoreductase subunit B [Methylobacterium radiodurans]
MTKRLSTTLAAALLLVAGNAQAAPRTYDLPEPTVELRAPKAGMHAEGFEAAQANCMVCHSVDYIAMQPPRKGQAFWTAEVTKMIKVYRAPIDEAQAKAIAAYLTDTY